jgi:DNA-directed RNA polymerase specialized sigma24 family protein
VPEKEYRMIQSGAACAPRGETARAEAGAPLTATFLYEHYQEDVYRYVSRRVARREDAEDVTAEVFIAAFAGLSRFRGGCPPRLWLLSIARRKVVDLRWKRPPDGSATPGTDRVGDPRPL